MDRVRFEGLSFEAFLGETEGPFLGADLRTGPPGAQAGSRRLRAAGVDALTPPSTQRGWSSGRAVRLNRQQWPAAPDARSDAGSDR